MMYAGEYGWRDILNTVLEGMNPWDIDLTELASRYSQKVDDMIEMNFRLPANVVLVSSVLLRMKSDVLSPQLEPDPYDIKHHMLFLFDSNYPIEAIAGLDADPYPIEAKPARLVKRRVTAEELIEALQSVMREKDRSAQRVLDAKTGKFVPQDVVLEDHGNIVLLIEETYSKVMERLFGAPHVHFSDIAKSGAEEVISTFISLLHLVNDRRLQVSQEDLYGEIYITAA